MVGFGIRLAQDVGVHRRKVHQHVPTAEDEQWKRGFWYVTTFYPILSDFSNKIFFVRVLVCMDRIISAAMGRPCAIHDDEYVCCRGLCMSVTSLTFLFPASTSNYLSTVMTSTGIIQIRNNDSSNLKINHPKFRPSFCSLNSIKFCHIVFEQ